MEQVYSFNKYKNTRKKNVLSVTEHTKHWGKGKLGVGKKTLIDFSSISGLLIFYICYGELYFKFCRSL